MLRIQPSMTTHLASVLMMRMLFLEYIGILFMVLLGVVFGVKQQPQDQLYIIILFITAMSAIVLGELIYHAMMQTLLSKETPHLMLFKKISMV